MRRISSVFFRKHFGGGKQTKVLMFWSILSTGAGTVVIFMFRGHVSACLKVSWSSCGCLEKNATHFLLKYAPCTSKCVGFSHPKKKHPMIPMVLPNHGHVFRGLEPPTEADPNFDVAGEPTCKAKLGNDFPSGKAYVQGLCYCTFRIVTHQVRWTNKDKVWW